MRWLQESRLGDQGRTTRHWQRCRGHPQASSPVFRPLHLHLHPHLHLLHRPAKEGIAQARLPWLGCHRGTCTTRQATIEMTRGRSNGIGYFISALGSASARCIVDRPRMVGPSGKACRGYPPDEVCHFIYHGR